MPNQKQIIRIILFTFLIIVLTIVGLYMGWRHCMKKIEDNPLFLASEFDLEFPLNFEDRTEAELEHWLNWKLNYLKQYNDRKESLYRQAIFLSNLRFIKNFNNNHNPRGDQSNQLDILPTFKLALNKFADMTTKEINEKYFGVPKSWKAELEPTGDINHYILNADVKKREIDYRSSTPVIIDQEDCRASAAYAAVANTESHYNLVNINSKPIKLSDRQFKECLAHSEISPLMQFTADPSNDRISINRTKDNQQLNEQTIDKLSKMYNLTIVHKTVLCSHGISAIEAFKVLERMQNGLILESDFEKKLESNDDGDLCLLPSHTASNNFHVLVSQTDKVHADNITTALNIIGPVTVSVDASQPTFHFYSSGYYQDTKCNPDSFNHHMLVVGYSPAKSVEPPQSIPSRLLISKEYPEHYIMKNSFGVDWGEKGYIKYAISNKNKCSPSGLAVYPNVYIPLP